MVRHHSGEPGAVLRDFAANRDQRGVRALVLLQAVAPLVHAERQEDRSHDRHDLEQKIGRIDAQ
jgi:hypothetical protein